MKKLWRREKRKWLLMFYFSNRLTESITGIKVLTMQIELNPLFFSFNFSFFDFLLIFTLVKKFNNYI